MLDTGSAWQGTGKILIVEDEFLVALQLEDIVCDGGHKVIATVPDREGLGAVSVAPDVVLVDLNLRDGLTGPEIAWKLAEQYAARVIYVTANPGQIGTPAPTAVGVVQKPFTNSGILSAISYALMDDPECARPPELEPLSMPPPDRKSA